MDLLAELSAAHQTLDTAFASDRAAWAADIVTSTQWLVSTLGPEQVPAFVVEPLLRTVADIDPIRSQHLRLHGLLPVLVDHMPATLPVLTALVRADDANAVSLVDTQCILDRLAVQPPSAARTALAEVLADQYEDCASTVALIDREEVLDALL